MESILVTGGAGFIGSCFVRQWLADQTTRLVNLDKLTYAGNPESLKVIANATNHRLVEGDILDSELVLALHEGSTSDAPGPRANYRSTVFDTGIGYNFPLGDWLNGATVRADALVHLGRLAGEFDLILADPPYALAELPTLPSAARPHLASGGLFVLEHDARHDFAEADGLVWTRAYGRTVLSVFDGGREE